MSGPAYWIWLSPNDVRHAVRVDGRCLTCGRYHDPACGDCGHGRGEHARASWSRPCEVCPCDGFRPVGIDVDVERSAR